MSKSNPFKWRHHQAQIILRCVRWYLIYPLSYRQVAEMVNERGMDVHHTTVFRWVQQYGPELDKRCRPHLKSTNDSWRVDETYIKVKGKDRYLYRAVDSDGNTLDLLTAKRDAEAAKRFLRRALNAFHTQEPRVINVDKNAAYPKAVDELKEKEELSEKVELRQNKYLNNRIEQDHRSIKRLVAPWNGIWFIQHSPTNIKGLRDYEHAKERTNSGSGEKSRQRTGLLH